MLSTVQLQASYPVESSATNISLYNYLLQVALRRVQLSTSHAPCREFSYTQFTL